MMILKNATPNRYFVSYFEIDIEAQLKWCRYVHLKIKKNNKKMKVQISSEIRLNAFLLSWVHPTSEKAKQTLMLTCNILENYEYYYITS